MKKIFSAHLQTLDAGERIEIIKTIIAMLASEAERIVKMMWALYEVVKEAELWSPQIKSFDKFKSHSPFEHHINLMPKQYNYSNKFRVPLQL